MAHAVKTDGGVPPNFLQQYLVPTESRHVRTIMGYAAEFAGHEHIVFSRIGPVALVVVAVAFSFFNALSYLIQIPIRALLEVVCFRPDLAVLGVANNLKNVALSLLFVSLGITFVVGGVFLPKTFFPFFAPYQPKSDKEQLEQTEGKIKELQREIQELTERHAFDIGVRNREIIRLQEQIKRQGSKWSF